jgi:hypothetical protein
MRIMRSYVGIVFISLSLILLFGSIETVRCDDWKLFQSSPDGESYYNMKQMQRTKDIVQISVKSFLSDDNKNIIMESRIKDGLPVAGWDKWSYIIWSQEVDCRERKIRYVKVTNYSDDGKVLDSSSGMKGNWKVIPPNSPFNNLMKEVCNISKRK